MTEFGLQFLFLCTEINRLEEFAGTTGQRLLAFQNNFLQFGREATHRLSDHPLEEIDNPLRESQFFSLGEDIFRFEVVLHQEHRHVADDLRRRCDLDHIAEEVVDLAVHLLALLPPMSQAKPFNLRLVVGVLATRNLVVVDLGRTAAQFRFERRIVGAHRFPVVG